MMAPVRLRAVSPGIVSLNGRVERELAKFLYRALNLGSESLQVVEFYRLIIIVKFGTGGFLETIRLRRLVF
jgi:hypothetical protein